MEQAKGGFETYVVDQLPELMGTAGGLVGGIAGSGAAGVGAIPGAIGGAGAGGYTGKALQNLYNSKFRPEMAPNDMAEVMTQPMVSGAKSAAIEGAGGKVAQVAAKGLSPVGRYIANKSGAVSGALKTGADELATNPTIIKAAQLLGQGAGASTGAAIAHSSGVPGAGLVGAFVGKDVLGPAGSKAATWTLDRVANTLRATPDAFGKFTQPLVEAAKQGPQALQTTIGILSRKPEFLKALQDAEGPPAEKK
jgi:hypothetical protein